jgi:hypothetical protein
MTFDENTTYKVLKNGRSCYGGGGQWTPNRNRYVRGKVVACQHGIHYCRGAQLLNWLGPELWLFEDRGDKHDDRDDKCVTNRGRITERIEAWNEEVARLFAVDCARAVIRYARDDQRELLHACLDVHVGYAGGYLDAAAVDAARDAAWDAAGAAARYAARAAARAAAWAAAWDAAWAAAGDAAWAAAGDAAGAAARAAARDDQYALLCRYLSGEEGPFVEAGHD